MTIRTHDKEDAIFNVGDFSIFEISRTVTENYYIAVSSRFPILVTFADLWELLNWTAERVAKHGDKLGDMWHDGTTDKQYLDKLVQNWGDESWDEFLSGWKKDHMKAVIL